MNVRETQTVNEEFWRIGVETPDRLIYMLAMRLMVRKRLLAFGLLLLAAVGVSAAFPSSAYAHGGAHRSAQDYGLSRETAAQQALPMVVVPAQASIQGSQFRCLPWPPAFAEVTVDNRRDRAITFAADASSCPNDGKLGFAGHAGCCAGMGSCTAGCALIVDKELPAPKPRRSDAAGAEPRFTAGISSIPSTPPPRFSV